MKIHIKNMVCNRCIIVVKAELEKLGLNPISVNLGYVEFNSAPNDNGMKHIESALQSYGFELIKDKKKQLTERVKNIIIGIVHQNDAQLAVNLSWHLSQKLNLEYAQISAIFSEIENQTIEKFFIAQKIERAKEMISYGEHTLSEIANLLNYSSVAHLSNQFKKVSGITPSQFKINLNNRLPLDVI